MKIYEALLTLQRNPKGYFVEIPIGSWYPSVYLKDTEDNFRTVWMFNALRGYKGQLLSFYGYNREETQKLLKREFEFCYTYEDLFNIFLRISKDDNRHQTDLQVSEILKKAVSRKEITQEIATKCLQRYTEEVTYED